MASSDVTDAEQLLAAAQASVQGPINDGVDQVSDLLEALEQETTRLEPVAEQLQEDVIRYRPYGNAVSRQNSDEMFCKIVHNV